MIEIENLTIEKAHEKLSRKEVTVRELVDACLAAITAKNPEMHAYLGTYTNIDQQVELAQKRFDEGNATILTGIPFAIKDNILVNGQTATASSKILENYTATYYAHVITLLKAEGAVLVGRANMDEFAMGGSTENSAYGVTKNPFDMTRVAGGSSGGSAAALAMGGCLAALGSDTGGSIRQPASFCGLVGLKPTYGAVSRSGVMAMGSSLDQIGPFAKTVRDAEIIFDVLSKPDTLDATSIPLQVRKTTHQPSTGKKIGVPFDFVRRDGIDPEVLADFEATIKKLESEGYEIVDVPMPNLHYALSVYYILMFAEVSSNMARYDGIRYGLSEKGHNGIESYAKTRANGFGKEVRRRIMLGTYVLSHGYYDAYYNKAQLVREMIRKEFAQAFETVDVVATPVSPIPAFKIGEKSEDPLAMYLADIFTVPANIAGVPAISVPTGKNAAGLPLSIQLTAPHFCEDRLFAVGKDVENTR
jgi:aspartyl-tRNA(Asn)/glutamyl-tRNA(Gln) amidotransferase subunit A